MTQPEREPRDLGSPVSFGLFQSNSFAVDFSPQAVSVDDVHPSEVDASPKGLPVQESVDSFSDLVPTLESDATVEKERQPEPEGILEAQPSENPTSPGDDVPPVLTPPLPPVKTPSSRSVVKSS